MPLDPIAFTDFKPGIADNPGIQYPPTQATRENTYRCIANEAGALTPAFRRNYLRNGTDFGTPASGSYIIDGIYVPTTVIPEASADPVDPSGRYHTIFIGLEYHQGGNRLFKLEAVRQYNNPVTTVVIRSNSVAEASDSGTGWGISWGTSRANRASPLDPGIVIMMFNWGSVLGAFTEYQPNDATPTVNSVFQVSTLLATSCVHQGRIVLGQITSYGFGADGIVSTSENLLWTNVNNPGVLSSPASVFVPENPTGYAIMAPMSANELFLLKTHGGVVIQGDLDDPTVINLPMMPGSGIIHRGAYTPIGYVYGSDITGLWAWRHGDSADNISPNMEPLFWMIFPDIYNNVRYHFASIDNYLFVSNNWIYDTKLGSWWRIEDEDTFQVRFFTAYGRFLYGAPTTYTDAAPASIYGWDTRLFSTSYSWQSHPIFQSIGNLLKVTEFEIIAKGKGTITITLTGIDGSTATKTVTLANNGFPERFRKPIAIQGQYIQLRIEADSGDAPAYSDTLATPTEAPTIYSVILHPDARSPISTAVG